MGGACENTRVESGAGVVSDQGLHFLGGSEACVRHAGGAGGGPFCFAYCRDDSAHLLPQEMSAGAKPNHAFSMCQHFCIIIFHSPSVAAWREAAWNFGCSMAARARAATPSCRMFEKQLVYRGISARVLLQRARRACRARATAALHRHLPGNKRKLSGASPTMRVRAPRKSKCAELRELFPSRREGEPRPRVDDGAYASARRDAGRLQEAALSIRRGGRKKIAARASLPG